MVMQSYIDTLKAEVETNRQRVDAKAKNQHADNRVLDGWEELPDQIEKFMLSLPPALKAGPFSLDFFRSKLRGKYKLFPSAGNLGIALTALGFVRKRDFSKKGAGRRLWLPSSKG